MDFFVITLYSFTSLFRECSGLCPFSVSDYVCFLLASKNLDGVKGPGLRLEGYKPVAVPWAVV